MAVNDSAVCFTEDSLSIYIASFVLLVCAIIVCTSFLVVITIWRSQELHGNTNIFFASLAVSDAILAADIILSLVATIPVSELKILSTNTMNSFIFGVNFGGILLSMVHMGVFAVDRYIQIAHPFYYMKNATKRITVLTLLCMWITGLFYMIIPLVFYTKDEYHEKCIILNPPLVYYCVDAVLYTVIFITIFICYFKIAHVAFRHKKAANARRLQINDVTGNILLRNNRMAAIRSAKFFALMFGTFSFCTFPPVLATGINKLYSLPGFIYSILMLLIPIHSIVNFLIYVNMNNDFSRVLKRKMSSLRRYCCTRDNQA